MLNLFYEDFNGFFMSILIIGITFGAYFIFKEVLNEKLKYSLIKVQKRSKVEILNEKFARGQISRKEYEFQVKGRK